MIEEFRILSDAEHIRKKLQMYAGSASIEETSGMFFGQYKPLYVIPALLKIISEIIDNSIDEAIRTNFEFANKISVSIKKESRGLEDDVWEVVVEDNGRGIPVVKLAGTDIYRPVAAWTQARAGSNFGDVRETIGSHGIGSMMTAVMSTEFVGETSDGKNHLVFVSAGMGKVKSVTVNKSSKQFTKVTFCPDLPAFSVIEISQDHLDFIRDRIENLAVCYPDIHFTFNDEKIKLKSVKEYAGKYCSTFVIGQDDKNVLIFGPSGHDEEFRVHSYVNGLWIKNGGSHINFVIDKIIETLRGHIKKKFKIDVLPNNIKQHLTFVSILRGMVNMKFDSQTKERITNTVAEVSAHLKDIDFDKISKQILNTEEIIDPMVAAILYKKELAENVALAKKLKSVSKTRIVNHIAATDPNPENRSCFIVEGLSALGSLIAVRNPKLHGALPLKGKVLNVRGMKPSEILKNTEVFALLSVLGLEFNKPVADLNYGKIVIMVDADVDGAGSIQCLLLNLFSNWPELFTQGRIYRAMTPLYVCTKGKNTELFYNKTDFEKFNSKGWEVAYCKGLGTMSKEAYEKCINDPFLVKISANDADFEKLEMSFGESAEKRKTWMIG